MAAFEILHVTAQYSNAVLLAVMPFVTDFAAKQDLPLNPPVTISQVRAFKCSPRSDLVGGRVILTNGHEFVFLHGHVEMYRSPQCYYELQDPDQVPRFFGLVKLTEKEAVQAARNAIKQMGYSEATLFADHPPQVIPPAKVGQNTVARYRVTWSDPSRGNPDNPPISADFEIDATTGKIHLMYLINPDTWRETPKIDVHPPIVSHGPETQYLGGRKVEPVSPAYADAFLKATWPQLMSYLQTAGFVERSPLTTDQIAKYDCGLIEGKPRFFLDFKSGARFIYSNGQVIAFFSSDVMTLPGRESPPFPQSEKFQARFYGPVNLNSNQAVNLVRQTIKRLGYSEKELGADKPPHVVAPQRYGPNTIARYTLTWREPKSSASRIVAEVDAINKALTSLYINDRIITNIWRSPPKIDVPMNPATNQPAAQSEADAAAIKHK